MRSVKRKDWHWISASESRETATPPRWEKGCPAGPGSTVEMGLHARDNVVAVLANMVGPPLGTPKVAWNAFATSCGKWVAAATGPARWGP